MTIFDQEFKDRLARDHYSMDVPKVVTDATYKQAMNLREADSDSEVSLIYQTIASVAKLAYIEGLKVQN